MFTATKDKRSQFACTVLQQQHAHTKIIAVVLLQATSRREVTKLESVRDLTLTCAVPKQSEDSPEHETFKLLFGLNSLLFRTKLLKHSVDLPKKPVRTWADNAVLQQLSGMSGQLKDSDL